MTDALFAQAAAGRGLWAGLFPLEGPELAPDAHVTLAHFGRRVSPVTVERALTACRRAAAFGPVAARSWATARMDQKAGSVIALLLEGEQLRDLHDTLHRHCAAVALRVDDRFAFHPHLTRRRLARSEAAVLAAADRVDLRFEVLTLVCGEAKITVRLLAPSPTAAPDQIALPF